MKRNCFIKTKKKIYIKTVMNSSLLRAKFKIKLYAIKKLFGKWGDANIKF